MRKKIGVLGGMGPEALSDMYLGICKYYQVTYGAKYDKDFPPMILYSVPIPDVVESIENEEKILQMLIEAAKTLEDDGCNFITIACNSVQFLLEEIRNALKINVIGIGECNAQYLLDKQFKKVGILSTKTTIDKKVYDNELAKVDIDLVKPTAEEQTIVTEVIMSQLSGNASETDTKKLVGVIEKLRDRDAEAILIACTDLPLVVGQKDTTVSLINCTKVYAETAAKLSAE